MSPLRKLVASKPARHTLGWLLMVIPSLVVVWLLILSLVNYWETIGKAICVAAGAALLILMFCYGIFLLSESDPDEHDNPWL